MAKENLRPYGEFFEAERWADAEQALRAQIDACGVGDGGLLVSLHLLLASRLAALGRSSEATASSRAAVEAAQSRGLSVNTVAGARHMLACQLLATGDATAALQEAQSASPSYKPFQSLLHTVSAEALFQLGRRSEARVAALAALADAPNGFERELAQRQLAEILDGGGPANTEREVDE